MRAELLVGAEGAAVRDVCLRQLSRRERNAGAGTVRVRNPIGKSSHSKGRGEELPRGKGFGQDARGFLSAGICSHIDRVYMRVETNRCGHCPAERLRGLAR